MIIKCPVAHPTSQNFFVIFNRFINNFDKALETSISGYFPIALLKYTSALFLFDVYSLT